MVTLASRNKTTESQLAAVSIREAYIYVRVSSFLQAQEGFSLPRQFEICQLQAKIAGQEVKEENQFHDVDSGAKFDRKWLTEILTRVKQGEVSVIYAPKVDRLARDVKDGLEILEVLQKHDVHLVLVENSIDTRTLMGKMLFIMLLMFAEWELTQIKERTWNGKVTKTGQYQEADKQFYGGGRYVPYGLRWHPPSKKPLEGRWEINQEERQWILKIFEWTCKGNSSIAVAQMLNARAVKAPAGGCWNDVTVRNMIRSTTYIGQYRYKLQGKEYIFTVPRTVPDELFSMANEQIRKNTTASRRNSKHEYLLGSLVRCLICHENGSEYILGGRFDASSGTYYRCSSRAEGRKVQHKVGGKKLENAVWEYLCEMLKDPSRVFSKLQRLQDATSREYREVQEQLQAISLKLDQNKDQEKRLAHMYRLGRLSEEVLDEESLTLEQETRELEGKQSLLRVQLEQAQNNTLPLRDVQDACALLAEGLEEISFEEKRWIIQTLVQRIYASKDTWIMDFTLPGLIPAGGAFERGMTTHTCLKSPLLLFSHQGTFPLSLGEIALLVKDG